MTMDPAIEHARGHVLGSATTTEESPSFPVPVQRSGPVPDDNNIPAQTDYFAFAFEEKCVLPDGTSWVTIKKLNEGDRKLYLNRSNRSLKLNRGGDAEMKLSAGDEKHQLLQIAITGWNLVSAGNPVPFAKQTLDRFLTVSDPTIIDYIEAAVHRLNPWLDADTTIEQLNEEIARLTEIRDRKIAEEEGKGTSEK